MSTLAGEWVGEGRRGGAATVSMAPGGGAQFCTIVHNGRVVFGESRMVPLPMGAWCASAMIFRDETRFGAWGGGFLWSVEGCALPVTGAHRRRGKWWGG